MRPKLSTIVLTIAVILVVGYLMTRDRGEVDTTPAPATPGQALGAVAVLPFAADSASYPAIGEGIVHLLTFRLDGSAGLRRVDPWVLLTYADHHIDGPLDERRAADIARALGARFFVIGRARERDQQIELAAELHDTQTGDGKLADASARGDLSHLPELVDELARGLLKEQPRAEEVQVARLVAVTSDHATALRAYLEGEAAARNGHGEEARSALQRAVDDDPEFALAHYRLAQVAAWTKAEDLAADSLQRALLLSNRLPEHERQVLNARLAIQRGDPADGERQYRRLLAASRDDWQAWLGLAELQRHNRTSSQEAFAQVHALVPEAASLAERGTAGD